MKKILFAMLFVLALPITFAYATDEEEQEDFSQKQIYNNSCYVANNPSRGFDEGTKGAVGCPPGSSQIVGRVANAIGRRNNSMTCVFGADYFFFSHSDGKCYKYETTLSNRLEREGGRWICYRKDSNDCD
jgi:hypothetical protein